ncbi:MAG: hypothetical protein IIV16_01875 [Alistipes sp.]|nr:hypothetical protein [Alistipes sp.]
MSSGINALYGVTPAVFYGVGLSLLYGARHKALLGLHRYICCAKKDGRLENLGIVYWRIAKLPIFPKFLKLPIYSY